MIIITDHTYYNSIDISIANFRNTSVSVQDAVPNTLKLVDKYTYNLLENAFGVKMFSEFEKQFDSNGKFISTDSKWRNLMNGEIYGNKKWSGLRFTRGRENVSLVAYFVWCRWHEYSISFSSSRGTNRLKVQDSVFTNGMEKYIPNWNKFVKMYQNLDYNKCLCNSSMNNGIVTLETYLIDNKDAFGWNICDFKRYELTDRFDF